MTFEEWFDREYPEDKFESHSMMMRLALKEVAEKAWYSSRQFITIDDI